MKHESEVLNWSLHVKTETKMNLIPIGFMCHSNDAMPLPSFYNLLLDLSSP